MTDILNDVILSKEIVDGLFNMDERVSKACDKKAKEICIKLFPEIDITREENVDLVVRPMSAVLALNELVLQNIFSMSSIDGVYRSTTLPDRLKVKIIKNFATLNGIKTTSNDVESIFSETKFGLKSKSMNRESNIRKVIEDNFDEINRLMFIESSDTEMDRNKLSYIQINHIDAMNFLRKETNAGTLIGTAYSRGDYQRYQDYKKSEKIEIPGTLDIYFSTDIVRETVTIQKNQNGMFELPEGFYIEIAHTSKNIAVLEDDGRRWGIVKTKPVIYVSNSSNEEEFSIVRYKNVDFDSKIETDDFTIVDPLFKGFYPAFLDFDIYTKYDSIDENRIVQSINEYLNSISGDMKMISHNDMSDYVRSKGDNIVIASTNYATVYTNLNMSFDTSVIFPITIKDMRPPVELDRSSFSERTIRVFARSINVIKE